jgi:hypothetical protein
VSSALFACDLFLPSLSDSIIFLTLTRLVVVLKVYKFQICLFTPSRRLSGASQGEATLGWGPGRALRRGAQWDGAGRRGQGRGARRGRGRSWGGGAARQAGRARHHAGREREGRAGEGEGERVGTPRLGRATVEAGGRSGTPRGGREPGAGASAMAAPWP